MDCTWTELGLNSDSDGTELGLNWDSDWTELGLLGIRSESDESDRTPIGLVGECKVLAASIACQVRRYFAHRTGLAPRKMPGSGKTYLRLFGERYRSSTQEGSSSTAAKALDQDGIDSGAIGRSVEMVGCN